MANELSPCFGKVAYQWYGFEVLSLAPAWESLSPATRAGWDTVAWAVILAYAARQAILEDQAAPARSDDRQGRVLMRIIAATEQAIAEFGYEAVYFGVACKVFPDAVHTGEGVDE